MSAAGSPIRIVAGRGSRIPIEGRWAPVPELLYTADLPPRAIVLWATLYGYAFRAGTDGVQETTTEQLSVDLHCSRSTLYDALTALLAAGWVTCLESGRRGRGRANSYRVNYLPEPAEEEHGAADETMTSSNVEIGESAGIPDTNEPPPPPVASPPVRPVPPASPTGPTGQSDPSDCAIYKELQDKPREVRPEPDGSATVLDLGLSEPPATVGKRAEALARGYSGRVPLSNHLAVRGVVAKALRADYPNPAVAAALDRLADAGRAVTTDSLRIELDGPPGRKRGGYERSAPPDTPATVRRIRIPGVAYDETTGEPVRETGSS